MIRKSELQMGHHNASFWDEGCLYMMFEDFYENFSEITISRYHKDFVLSQYKAHRCANYSRYFEISFERILG